MVKRIVFIWMVLFSASVLSSEFVPEVVTTKQLGDHQNNKWFWAYGVGVPFIADSRSYLFDDTGKNLGQLNNGVWFNSLVIDRKRDELLAVETYFSRGVRGERTDVVTVYDSVNLAPKHEIAIPKKRMSAVKSTGVTVFSDDNRFLLVVNYTPAQTISVVDLDSRSFVTEIETPGCSVVYPAGDRDFYSICGNGGFLHIRLDDDGQVVLKKRNAPIFDPVNDFLTTAASRSGDVWYFVSFENNVYAITMNEQGAEVTNRWSLISEQERKDNWRISGQHHTALHKSSGQLFVLMHQGDPETFEEPGEEAWVYDINTGEKVNTIELDDVALSIGVSQDQEPTLYSLAFHVHLPALFALWIYGVDGEAELMKHVKQVVDLYDAKTGEHQQKVGDIPPGYLTAVEPW